MSRWPLFRPPLPARPPVAGVVLALVLVASGAGCAGERRPGPAAAPPPAVQASSVSVVLTQNSYRPSMVHARPGEAVLLSLSNPDDEPHDLNLLGLAEPVHLFLNGHKAIVSSVTLPRPGTYRFFCSLGAHRAAGMEGEVLVDG